MAYLARNRIGQPINKTVKPQGKTISCGFLFVARVSDRVINHLINNNAHFPFYFVILSERSEREDPPQKRNNRPNKRPICVKGAGDEADWGIVGI